MARHPSRCSPLHRPAPVGCVRPTRSCLRERFFTGAEVDARASDDDAALPGAKAMVGGDRGDDPGEFDVRELDQ